MNDRSITSEHANQVLIANMVRNYDDTQYQEPGFIMTELYPVLVANGPQAESKVAQEIKGSGKAKSSEGKLLKKIRKMVKDLTDEEAHGGGLSFGDLLEASTGKENSIEPIEQQMVSFSPPPRRKNIKLQKSKGGKSKKQKSEDIIRQAIFNLD